ncbi:hypothetical protein [Candidatus Korobacter versatilis]|uniref:hypothetical protein n=1 Tax=Candidatus Korobacter versatilis TaxID=658062 RepID=UPI0002FD7DE9|nr:hypothetical protein [Candidatus Koribacter versatilis]
MQSAMTILTVVGGLVFSVSCALLVEELIFGGLFKLFFQKKSDQSKTWFIGSADRPVLIPVKVEQKQRRAK